MTPNARRSRTPAALRALDLMLSPQRRESYAFRALALGSGDFRVYALDTSGERVREVPCGMSKGRLRFKADVAADPDCATFLYEIIREQ